VKTNPLAADRLGPNALVRWEGKTYKSDRPTSRGWELVETGSRRRRDITHAQLQRGEDDRTIVVTRSKGEDPSLQSLSLKSRRDIFIKTWWLNKIIDALRTKTLDSTGDVALRKFFDRHLTDMREALTAWEKDSGYDHSIDREKKPRKPNVGSEIRVDEDDLGAISVLLDGEWITVPALDTDFVGVSLDQWIELLEDLRMRFGEQAEIDFERYVAPALLDIEKANRKAERALKLNDVFWSEERFGAFEDQNQINFVNRARPEAGVPAPSFGEGTIGRRFERPAQPRFPEPPIATPTPAVEPAQPDHDQPTDQQPRRRLTYRED